jgi:hypothetical protein
VTPSAIVEAFLRISLIPDPQGAHAFASPQFGIRFTGSQATHDPVGCSVFNAGRYQWVRKRFEQTDVVSGATDGGVLFWNVGGLSGEWPEGTPATGSC